MENRNKGKKLNRTASHRESALRNMATSLFEKERIKTTLAKAKALQPYAEKLITTARKGGLSSRRHILKKIKDKDVVAKLMNTLGPRYSERPGGYTRILKLGFRKGDGAEMALIELVQESYSASDQEDTKEDDREETDEEKSTEPSGEQDDEESGKDLEEAEDTS